MVPVALPLLAGLLLQLAAPQARGVDPASEVVVLVNEAVPAGERVAAHYLAARGIPAGQVCRIRTGAGEVITREAYRQEVEAPLAAFLAERPRVRFVVPVYGVPVKVAEQVTGDIPADADALTRHVTAVDAACVDRELEQLRLSSRPPAPGWSINPALGAARLRVEDRVLVVMRLDGPTPELAEGLIELARQGEAYGVSGTHLLDLRGLQGADGYASYDRELAGVAQVFAQAGLALRQDEVEAVVDPGTLGQPGHYWGWYAGTLQTRGDWRFAPGAVTCHVHSFSAEVLRDPGRNWVGPLLARGATVAVGTVYEPLTAGFPGAPAFWRKFLAGVPVGEALLLSNRCSSWMSVWVGDPLYAPYAADVAPGQAERRATAAGAVAELTRLLDAGELEPARTLAERLRDWPPCPEAGDPAELRFLLAEVRGRARFGGASGSVAALRAALAALEPARLGRDWKALQKASEAALQLSPGCAEANLGLGLALLGQERPALEPLERAREVAPDDPRVAGALARALLAAGRAEDALPLARAAGEAAAAGEALLALGRAEEARAALEAAAAEQPRDAARIVALARAQLACGQPREAAARLHAALAQLLPADPVGVPDYEQLLDAWLEALRAAKERGPLQAAQSLRKALPRPERPGRKTDRLRERVEALQAGGQARPLPLPAPQERPGPPRLALSAPGAEPVRVWLAGPELRALELRSGRPPQELVLYPGRYRLLVEAGGEVWSASLELGPDQALTLTLPPSGK